jgi:hypothetical protein
VKGAPRIHKDRNRKGTFRRASSPEGVEQRQQARIATMPKETRGKGALHFIKPGSRNPRKVTR